MIFVSALDTVACALCFDNKVAGRGLLCRNYCLLELGISGKVDFFKYSGLNKSYSCCNSF